MLTQDTQTSPGRESIKIYTHNGNEKLTVFENPFSLDSDSGICSEEKHSSGNGQTDRYT